MSAELATLRKVEFLAPLDDAALAELLASGRRERFAAGQRIVTELEFGCDVFVLLDGEAEVSVEPRLGDRQLLGRLAPGAAIGEMSSLTGELRSATVTAVGPLEALRIPDATFDRLRERRPEVALALLRVLARRLGEAEQRLDELLAAPAEAPARAGEASPRRGSIARAWRELVVQRGRDLGFLALAGFVLTLLGVRALVFLSFHFAYAPRELLRAAYTSGFLLLMVSAATSLLTFRPPLRRAIAVAYGVACALIANELGVTLAFDIFYKDIHTADPSLVFDVERLYRRSEPARAIVLGLVVLVQLAYLRGFYRRAAFVVLTRLRRLVSRSPAR
jgi:CRP-like cAMP-binding protein